MTDFKKKRRVLVGLTGGMNSSVTAALLQSQGDEVHGVYLKKSSKPCFMGLCGIPEEEKLAQEMALSLGISFKVVDAEDIYENEVLDPYVHGRLQNQAVTTCVDCQSGFVMKALFQLAKSFKMDAVSTGHCAQVQRDPAQQGSGIDQNKERWVRLLRSSDPLLDESFYLYRLTQEQLSMLILPLGGLTQKLITKLAGEFQQAHSAFNSHLNEYCDLSPAEKTRLLTERVTYLYRAPGVIKLRDGSVVGQHDGLYQFKLGDSPRLDSSVQEKWVVVGFDPTVHALFVGSPETLKYYQLRAHQTHWVRPIDPLKQHTAQLQLSPRNSKTVSACLTLFENSTVIVETEDPLIATEIGQNIVFYDQNEVIGGAIVQHVGKQASIQ